MTSFTRPFLAERHMRAGHETNFTEWVGFWFFFPHVFTQDVWNLSRDFAQVELCYWHCWLAVDCNCFSSLEESTLSCKFVVIVGVVRFNCTANLRVPESIFTSFFNNEHFTLPGFSTGKILLRMCSRSFKPCPLCLPDLSG